MLDQLSEQTALRLVSAIERLADAMERGGGAVPAASMIERAYVAKSIIDGPEAAIAENRRNRLRRPRKKYKEA